MKKLLFIGCIIACIHCYSQGTSRVWKLVSQGNALSDFKIDGDFTFEALVKLTKENSSGRPNPILHSFAGSGYFNLSLESVDVDIIAGGGGGGHRSLNTGFKPQLNTWYHFAVSYDGLCLRVYINGCLMDSLLQKGKLYYYGNALIGQNDNSGNYSAFTGELDEMRFWSEARSQDMLKANIHREINFAQEEGLFGYINNEGTRLNRIDELGNRPTFFIYAWGGNNTISPSNVDYVESFTLDSLSIKPLSCTGVNDASVELFTPYSRFESSLNSPFEANKKNFTQLPAGEYQLEIRLETGCLVRAPVIIEKRRSLEIELGHSGKPCLGDTLSVSAQTEDSVHIEWQNGTKRWYDYAITTYRDSMPLQFTVKTWHKECMQLREYNIDKAANTKFEINQSRECIDDVALLCINAPEKVEIQWEHSRDTACTLIRAPGNYTCTVKNQLGCKNTKSINIADCHPQFFLPSAFTPDGDGINDVFEIISPQLPILSMRIYNRWGELIVDRSAAPWIWKGDYRAQAAPVGSYLVELRYLDKDFQARTKLMSVRLLY